MPIPRERVSTSDTSERKSRHPKEELYDAYDGLSEAWFETVFTHEHLQQLKIHTRDMGTEEMLLYYEDFFRFMVDKVFDAAEYDTVITDAVEIVDTYKENVDWVGQLEPAPDASIDDVGKSLRHKFKRNISLALLEMLAILESGVSRVLTDPEVSGDVNLAESMRISRTLYERFARIHGEHARMRLQAFTRANEITHPETTIKEILEGSHVINAQHMRLTQKGEDLFSVDYSATTRQWREEAKTIYPESLETPTMVCPGQRLFPEANKAHAGLGVWNEYLWVLLIDIYQRSGRFQQLKSMHRSRTEAS